MYNILEEGSLAFAHPEFPSFFSQVFFGGWSFSLAKFLRIEGVVYSIDLTELVSCDFELN